MSRNHIVTESETIVNGQQNGSPDAVVIIDNTLVPVNVDAMAAFAAHFAAFCAAEHAAMKPLEVVSNAGRSGAYVEWVNGWD